MKKKFYSVTALIFTAGLLYSQTITVTSPAGGETWCKGGNYPITWAHPGTMDANVKIRLMKGHGSTEDLVLKITDSSPNDGSYTWTVPNTLNPGQYLIRIKTVDNAVGDDGEFFQITNPSITVTSPASGSTWLRGSIHTILWDRCGGMNANVKIRLMKGHGGTEDLVLAITESSPNDGSFDWDIPASVAPGQYLIRIKTIDNLVEDDGEYFTIPGEPQNQPDLVIRDMTVTARDHTYDGTSRPYCRAKVVNQGSGRSEPTVARLRIYSRGVLPISRRFQWVEALDPGEHATFSQLPELPRPGKYRYILKADPDNQLPESDDNNNSDTKLYNLKPCQLPDLTVTLGIDKVRRLGIVSSRWVTVIIKNTGKTRSGECRLMTWVDGPHLRTFRIPDIKPGHTRRQRLMKLPLVAFGGRTKTIMAEIDRFKDVDECDETNNRAERTYNF